MTMREVFLSIHHIDVRRHNNFAMQAALHGHKIKPRVTSAQANAKAFTPEESAAADRAMLAALKRSKLSKKGS